MKEIEYDPKRKALVEENERLKGKVETLEEELKAERLRNLKDPISSLGRIIKELHDLFANKKIYGLENLLDGLARDALNPEDERARVVIRGLIHNSLRWGIITLHERWEWLDAHREPVNDYLVQLANETQRIVYCFHDFLIRSKNLFDNYEEFKTRSGAELIKLYDVYNRIANETESFFKTYETKYEIQYMGHERIV